MFASLYEGFGLPILEGQAVGRPVITSNLYSMPEVAGVGASFVDPYKIDEIATAVERIISDSDYRKNLIERGRDNVEKYSRHSVAVQYADIYRNIYAARLR